MNVIVELSGSTTPSDNCPTAEQLQAWAELTLRRARQAGHLRVPEPGDLQISLRLVSEQESAQLNHSYRGKNRATNVLSFPGQLPEEMLGLLPARPLGDLAICPAIVQREASEQQKAALAHWAHMLIHGLLHLLGLDHQTEAQAEIMENLEIRILQELGYPDPYIIPEQRSPESQ